MSTIGGEIFHGTWVPSAQQFFLWGETPEPVRRKGRQPKVPPHPFHCPPETLRRYLDHLGVEALGLTERALTLWLPSPCKLPVPSPELQATGAMAPPQGAPDLQPWQVPGVLLPAGPALTLLSTLQLEGDGSRGLGSDLRAWRLAALLA